LIIERQSASVQISAILQQNMRPCSVLHGNQAFSVGAGGGGQSGKMSAFSRSTVTTNGTVGAAGGLRQATSRSARAEVKPPYR
jgi:hypothetical protein